MTKKQRYCLMYYAGRPGAENGSRVHRFTVSSCVRRGWLSLNPHFGDAGAASRAGFHPYQHGRVTPEGLRALSGERTMIERSPYKVEPDGDGWRVVNPSGDEIGHFLRQTEAINCATRLWEEQLKETDRANRE